MPAVLPISQAYSAAAFKPSSAAAAATSADAEASGGAGAGPSVAGRSGAAGSSAATEDSLRGCALRELPSGSIGRLLVYRSGKVKLKIGEVLMDVMPGLPCKHRIDVSFTLRLL